MMVLNSRSFLSPLLAVLVFSRCQPAPKPHCQAVIVLDKTNSVSYAKRWPLLRQEITEDFVRTYFTAIENIQCSRLIITGNTRFSPEVSRFDEVRPNAEGRSGEEDLEKWEEDKQDWIDREANRVDSLVSVRCTSNTTDIFSIFSGIQQVQRTNGSWDSVKVFIFSDMVNTAGPDNMNRMPLDSANAMGREVCKRLIRQGQITAGNTENIYLTIYTPDTMDHPALVNLFWKGFFAEWGLSEKHYHFE
jgi:hypothetical protein